MGSRPPAAGWAQHSTLKERVPAIPYTPDEGQQAETGSVKHGLASHFSSLALATRVTRSYTYKRKKKKRSKKALSKLGIAPQPPVWPTTPFLLAGARQRVRIILSFCVACWCGWRERRRLAGAQLRRYGRGGYSLRPAAHCCSQMLLLGVYS